METRHVQRVPADVLFLNVVRKWRKGIVAEKVLRKAQACTSVCIN